MRGGRSFLHPAIVVLVVSMAVATPAMAWDGNLVWLTERAPIVEYHYDNPGQHRMVSDGNGGVIAVWQYAVGGGIRVQRLDDSGTQLWTPADGETISATGYNPDLSPHAGGAVVAWDEQEVAKSGIFVQRVNASGTPQWTAGGVQIGTSGSRPVVHADAVGGAFVAWEDGATGAARIAYVDAAGNVGSPGVDGIPLGADVGLTGDMRILAGGPSGVIVVWADDAIPSRILAQNVPISGVWGATPKIVSTDPSRFMDSVDAAGDGAGGVVISWVARFPNYQVRVQHLDQYGNTLWTPNGVVVVDSAVVGGDFSFWSFGISARVVSDDAGGAIVAWSDWRDAVTGDVHDNVYLQRVVDGGFPAWAENGVLVPEDPSGRETKPVIAADGRGGVVVAYEEFVNGPPSNPSDVEIVAARFDTDGNRHWGYPIYFDSDTEPSYDQIDPRIVFDGSGPSPVGAIVGWYDDEDEDLYALKVEISHPANDECVEAFEIGPGDYEGTLAGGTLDGNSVCGGTDSDLWYRFVPPAAGMLRVTTCGSNDIGGVDAGIDTVLSLHSPCPDTGSDHELTCNDDWTSSADEGACADQDLGAIHRDSYVEQRVEAGQDILIRVSRYSGSTNGPFLLHVMLAPENDDCVHAADIGPGSFYGTLVDATDDGSATCRTTFQDVWFRYIPPAAGIVHVNTCGTNDLPGEDAGIDTVLTLHGACPDEGGSHELEGACNDDWPGGSDPLACSELDFGFHYDSALAQEVPAGEPVWIRVSRLAGSPAGEFRLNLDRGFVPAGRVPHDELFPGPPLLVEKAGDDVVLIWEPSCMPGDAAYAVYQGPLGGPLIFHEPVECNVLSPPYQFRPLPESVYFLVVPHNYSNEGSYGLRSGPTGPVERPQGAMWCYPQAIGDCP